MAKQAAKAESTHDYWSNGSESEVPYFNNRRGGLGQSWVHGKLLKYFMTVRMSHPVSDTAFRSITFSSTLVNHAGLYQANTDLDSRSFCDLVDFGCICRDFMGYQEPFVPGMTCLVHLDLHIVPLNETMVYSALIFLPEVDDFQMTPDSRKGQHALYLANIQLREGVRVTLLFKSSEIAVSASDLSPNGTKNTYNGSDQEERKMLAGFSLVEAFCELLSDQSTGYAEDIGFDYSYSHGAGASGVSFRDEEMFARNSLPNSYAFTDSYMGQNLGFHRQTQKHRPERHRPMASLTDQRQLQGTADQAGQFGSGYGSNHVRQKGSSSGAQSGKQIGGQQLTVEVNHNKQKARHDPHYSNASKGQHSHNQISQEASNSSAELSHRENGRIFSKPISNFEELLKDPKLIKAYANSKSKCAVLKRFLTDLKEDQVPQLLESLSSVLKDICKNKHGNYFAQAVIKKLPKQFIPDYLKLVSDSNLAPTWIHSDSLPSEGNVCHPRNYFVT